MHAYQTRNDESQRRVNVRASEDENEWRNKRHITMTLSGPQLRRAGLESSRFKPKIKHKIRSGGKVIPGRTRLVFLKKHFTNDVENSVSELLYFIIIFFFWGGGGGGNSSSSRSASRLRRSQHVHLPCLYQ